MQNNSYNLNNQSEAIRRQEPFQHPDLETCPLIINNSTVISNENTITNTTNKDPSHLYEDSKECLWQSISIEVPTIILANLIPTLALASPQSLAVSFASHFTKCMIVKQLDQLEITKDHKVLSGAIGGAVKYSFKQSFKDHPDYISAIIKGAYNGAMYAYGTFRPYTIEIFETFLAPNLGTFLSDLLGNNVAGAAATFSEDYIYPQKEKIIRYISELFSYGSENITEKLIIGNTNLNTIEPSHGETLIS